MYTGPSSSSLLLFTALCLLRCGGGAVGGVLGDGGGESSGLRVPPNTGGDGGGELLGLIGRNRTTALDGDGGGELLGLIGRNRTASGCDDIDDDVFATRASSTCVFLEGLFPFSNFRSKTITVYSRAMAHSALDMVPL